MSDFETRLLAEITRVRELLRQDETMHSFRLEISATGRMDGETRIESSLYADGEYNRPVEGGRLDAVVSELLRRRGWSARHAALCLPNVQERPSQEVSSDEIPF